MKIGINTKTGELSAPPKGGRSVGFISFSRLEDALRRVGEIRYNETITHIEFNASGVSYTTESDDS